MRAAATRMLEETGEWSMGNGQCPDCGGVRPDAGWWTNTVGHKTDCCRAKLMESLGSCVIYEMTNPERAIGSYLPDSENQIIKSIRFNDPDKKKKLAIGRKQFNKWG
uniref:Uncharacterized protein n=1 Tax=viral metagenome TaxID=1070528 RepID=A0A6M3L007_9ZZZZ